MRKRRIDVSIVTAFGDTFGGGHFMRMCTLALYLQRRGCSVELISEKNPAFVDGSIEPLLSNADPSGTIIIRDKRDSTIDEIRLLQSSARVVAVDDVGAGRSAADVQIDLLPNLLYPYNPNLFIPGVAFFHKVQSLSETVKKEPTLLVYSPFSVHADFRAAVQDAAPGLQIRYCGDSGVQYENEIFSASLLLSHFGVSLFEGNLCGAHVAAVNPSEYHSQLCLHALPVLPVVNCGVYPSVDYAKLSAAAASAQTALPVDVGLVRSKIEHSLETVFSLITA